MIRTLRFAAVTAVAFVASLGAATQQQRPSATGDGASITAREIDAHLRFPSHDLLEGRAPATRGAVGPAGGPPRSRSQQLRYPLDVVALRPLTP